MIRVASLWILVVLAMVGCKSPKAVVQEARAEAEEGAAEEPEPVRLSPASNPTILNLLVTFSAKQGVEAARLDSVFEKSGELNRRLATISSDEHRLRMIFKSEDGAKKVYQWMRHPLFLKIPVPAQDGKEATTMDINTESAQIYITIQKQPWFHEVVFESFPPKSAGKKIGSARL